ncbi:phosphatidylinositol-glycan biosynthesis class W protein [Denticeps clupeoides]|uniref:Phosphatidylinositol-glycan biosynthesis class W protein n=1 Tax=Denticeps clupeoides TaxID=299321 RepID=A0AAY4EQK1_9TELE|nr:phosphatidylinositol-glycan biosynthesis class W protein [Denticeps clupeoides]
MSGVMTRKELKEAFVSHLNGTSLGEVALGSFLAPLCLLGRGLLVTLHHLSRGAPPRTWTSHLLRDFALLTLPLVLSCTVLSDVLHWVIAGLALVDCALLFRVCRGAERPGALSSTLDRFLKTKVEPGVVPFVTVFRVLVNVKTAISILAVDFAVFPRRYAKTETYGTGVMDFGVGAFVLANALVSPEARKKASKGSRFSHALKQFWSVWPLVLLGMARLLSLKVTGYQEHVSEYGVHWNFFFTLAIVRVSASGLLAIFPANKSWLVALLIAAVYQVSLEATGLKAFLVHNGDRTSGFLVANKEGIFSVVGYVAIYMAGVQIGLYVMETRVLVRDWLRVLMNLMLGSVTLYVVLYFSQTFVDPVSRRMANASFCIWTTGQALFFLSLLGVADLILLYSKFMSNSSSVASSWNVCEKKSGSRQNVDGLCLLQSINRNQLLFFLLANVLTGLTNACVDTVNCGPVHSVCALLAYMFVNSAVMFILHRRQMTVKFW